ncbi:YafY family protein [Rhodococcus sp. B10]|uniref:helix-turn-helix transcriptional regulator n=1 Tax=Rhodococcus sp. B10 TaxID=2695876 RepID=UPI00197CDA94|nr:YafY family protein [Rhodococcus sp. B10]
MTSSVVYSCDDRRVRADRLISLVLLLRNRGRMSASQLAVELEVSERTVLRDIDALSTSGFPVFAERGRHGGFELLPGFTTDLTGLTAEEATALMSADASASLGMGSAFASAMRKVAASLPDEQRRVATSVADRVLVRPEGWLRDPERDEYLDVVQRGVFLGRRLRLDYAGRSGTPSVRTVDPIGLVYAAGHWYLMATVDGDERTYRVSRIRRAELLDDDARRSTRVDLGALWDAGRRRFRSSRDTVSVRLRVRPDQLDHVAATAIRVDETSAPHDGWIGLDALFGGVAHACSTVWMLGDDCELLGPEDVRAAVFDRAQRMMTRHAPHVRAST